MIRIFFFLSLTLQISDLRITDSGTYQCLVQTTEGTDYKTITLSVVGKAFLRISNSVHFFFSSTGLLFWEWSCLAAATHGHFWAVKSNSHFENETKPVITQFDREKAADIFKIEVLAEVFITITVCVLLRFHLIFKTKH